MFEIHECAPNPKIIRFVATFLHFVSIKHYSETGPNKKYDWWCYDCDQLETNFVKQFICYCQRSIFPTAQRVGLT